MFNRSAYEKSKVIFDECMADCKKTAEPAIELTSHWDDIESNGMIREIKLNPLYRTMGSKIINTILKIDEYCMDAGNVSVSNNDELLAIKRDFIIPLYEKRKSILTKVMTCIDKNIATSKHANDCEALGKFMLVKEMYKKEMDSCDNFINEYKANFSKRTCSMM